MIRFKNKANLLFQPALTQKNVRYIHQSAPALPLLDELSDKITQNPHKPNLERTAFIGVQHVLESTATMFDSLIKLGAKPDNMFFAGKCYSTSPAVADGIKQRGIHLMPTAIPTEPGEYQAACKEGIRQLWEVCQNDIAAKNIDKIVILDEGGRCLETMPKYLGFQYKIAGIEQTRGGLYNNQLDNLVLPLIEVASSAVKKKIESPLIATAILNRVAKILPTLKLNKNTVYGVIGNGAIGNAIVQHLLNLGYYVAVYDADPNAFANIKNNKLRRMPNITTLIANTQCIFGCTGKDVTQGIDVLNTIQGNTIFISCSSEDKEFLSLLKEINKQSIVMIDPLLDITCRNQMNMRIKILGGGFPINFDRSPVSVPSNDIAITRGLLLGACVQAASIASRLADDGRTINKPSRHALDPYLQQYVLQRWLKGQHDDRYEKSLLELFDDINWIKSHSGGKYYQSSLFTDAFSKNQTLSTPTNFKP